MRYSLIGKNIEVTPELREYFESRLEKLDRLTPTFSEDLISLQATVEQNLKRGDFSMSLSLHLPRYTLHAEDRSRELKGAVRTAFDDLIRQVGRFKSKLRGEHRWASEKHATTLLTFPVYR
jgi:ribosome hibernation promoting factor